LNHDSRTNSNIVMKMNLWSRNSFKIEFRHLSNAYNRKTNNAKPLKNRLKPLTTRTSKCFNSNNNWQNVTITLKIYNNNFKKKKKK